MNLIKRIIKNISQLVKRPYHLLFHNKIGNAVEICKGAYLTHSLIGDYSYLGMYSYFNHVHMGRYCSISGYVTIGAMEHDYTEFSTSTHLSDGGYRDRITTIGNDVWIGAQSVIRQGITIGNGAVIGANSFVNKDVPPYAIVFGSPAKLYKYRFSPEILKQIEESGLLQLSPSEAESIINELKSIMHETEK